MLIIENFAKRFNTHVVLEIDRQEFAPGVHWIKGENGSGKSTLFKSISGIIPFQGSISFSNGPDICKEPVQYRRLVNYSEAEPAYPGFLTAKDLVRFTGKIRNETLAGQDEYAQLFGVDQFFDKPCETYSSGMMKKLSLMMAFFGDPKLIILDEPLITLDERARSVLFNAIRQKLENKTTTFLMSSHQNLAPTDLPIVQTLLIQNKKLTVI